jgi:hypothetical protein
MVEYCGGGILPDIKNIPLGNERMRIAGSVEVEQLFLCRRFLTHLAWICAYSSMVGAAGGTMDLPGLQGARHGQAA